ncbi:MAG TPA: transporter substrate-binding domain-containing protein [Xanthomonadales bacterium]|nr:transporter substrate-binding domain-containing protein [Xanthomonadales bacterium]
MLRLAALACCLALWPAACPAAAITLSADEWYPYNGTPGAAREGYMIDLARAIAARTGDEVQYRTFDWETSLARVRAGTDDCAVAATAVDGEGLALSTQPFGRSVNAFFVRRDATWRFDGMDSLADVHLAAIAGYSYGAELDAWLATAPAGRVERVENSRRALRQAFALLLSGRVDAVIEDELVAAALAEQMGVRDRVRDAGRAPGDLDLYLACAPNERGRELAERFGNGLRAMRDSGELATILARYDLQDWLLAR